MLKKSIVIATLAAFALGTAALAQNAPVSPSPPSAMPSAAGFPPTANRSMR
jgi:hypothetical protein